MNCSNCGTFNNLGSKFCIKCGQTLPYVQTIQSESTQTVNNTSIQNNSNFQTIATPTNSVNNLSNNISSVQKISFIEYFLIVLAVILKPFTTFKEELHKFNIFKNSAILSLIVSIIATLVNLIKTMLNVVRVKSFDWSSSGYKTTWTWENLKELDYVQIIGKNFLIYLGIIVAIAVIYYIAGLIVKKQPNFSRLLGISALAVSPMLVCSLILSPLLSMMWVELAMPITLVGAIYTIVILYEGMNNEVLLDNNTKYYFNLICLSILGIAAYYLYMKLIASSISSGFANIMDLFG